MAKLHDKAQAAKGSYGSGIALLDYACIQRISEHQRFLGALEATQKKGIANLQENNKISDSLIKHATVSLGVDYKAKKKNKKASNLYYYGLALALTGNPLTVNIFDELTTNLHKGEFAGRASLSLGDYYLDKQDVPKALREYGLALKSGNAATKSYTRYKMAWTEFALAYNQKDASKQRLAISKLASLKKEANDKSPLGEVLGEIIKGDLLDLLTVLGNVADAKKILERIESSEIFVDLLGRMAHAKIEQGDGAAAYPLFAQMIKERPLDKSNVDIHIQMVYASAQTKNVQNILANLKIMEQSYVNSKSPWSKGQDPSLLTLAAKKVEDITFEFATSLDQEGSKLNNPAYLSAALQLYQMFIRSFPNASREYEAEFLYDQLLFQLNKFQISANLLRKLLLKNPQGKFSKDALELMITAGQKTFESDKNVYTLPAPGMVKRSIKIPDPRQLFADCLDLYVKMRPKNQDVPTMYFTSATLYFDFGHYAKANERYQKFIQVAPTNDSAVTAALRILFTTKTYFGEESFASAKAQIAKYPQLMGHKSIAPYYTEGKATIPVEKKAVADISTAAGKKASVANGTEANNENDNQENDDNNSTDE